MSGTKYKKTGIEWMPDIPVHWQTVRIKNVAKVISGATPKSGVATNWDGEINWITPAEFGQKMFIGESVRKITKTGLDSCAATLVPPGTIIISNRAPIGSLGIANVELSTNQGCKSLLPISIDNYFLYFVLSLQSENLNVLGNGTTFRELSTSSLRCFDIPFPPPEEQKSISSFLIAEYEKIAHFVERKERFIELLKEQRQSIITHAATKGIDPTAKLKPSGVDFFGDIPEHWTVRRLGTIGKFCKGGNVSRSALLFSGEGVPSILYGDLYTKYDIVVDEAVNRISRDTAKEAVELSKGDLLFSGSGETKEDIGKCVLFNGNEPTYAGGDIIIFRQEGFDSHYISYSQNSSIAKYQKAISSKGEIIVHTYGSKLRDVFMPFPPSINEQKIIVNHIKSETRLLDITISKAEREIELMKEYREAMIAEAVTGKKSVS